MCMNVFFSACVLVGSLQLGSQMIVSHRVSAGKSNLSSSQKQPMLSTTDLSLQPHLRVYTSVSMYTFL